MAEQSCATCRFAKPAEIGDMHECRRHAPASAATGRWPSVFSDDWCGEHQAMQHRSEHNDFERMTRELRECKPVRDGGNIKAQF